MLYFGIYLKHSVPPVGHPRKAPMAAVHHRLLGRSRAAKRPGVGVAALHTQPCDAHTGRSRPSDLDNIDGREAPTR
eukprot:8772651-Pyramimonas_sp.AAC.1